MEEEKVIQFTTSIAAEKFREREFIGKHPFFPKIYPPALLIEDRLRYSILDTSAYKKDLLGIFLPVRMFSTRFIQRHVVITVTLVDIFCMAIAKTDS